MSASFLTSVNRLTSSAYPLPALSAIVGSVLLADAVLRGQGQPTITAWFGKGIPLETASLAIVSGFVGALLLAHVFLPSWFTIGRFICSYIPGVRVMISPRITDKPDQYHYRISDVERRAIEKSHKQASDMVNERRAEVDRERKLRHLCAAMFAAFFIDLCFEGSMARQIIAAMHEPSGFAIVMCLLTLVPLMIAFGLALVALTGTETDDWIVKYPLEGFMEEPLTGSRVVGHGPVVSPLARHANFPSVS